MSKAVWPDGLRGLHSAVVINIGHQHMLKRKIITNKIFAMIMRDHCPKCRRDGQARYTYTNKTPLRVAAMIILVYVYLFRHFFFSISIAFCNRPTSSYFSHSATRPRLPSQPSTLSWFP